MANVTWKIARRSNVQLPLAIVLALAVVLVLLGKAENAMFDRARMRITDWMQPALSLVYAPVAGANRWAGSVGDIFRVYQENLALKQENARLQQWRNAAVVMQGQVRRYQSLLHAVPAPDVKSVLARVIGRASRPFLETMILDAGSAASVKPGEAVLDASGMIGRIYLAGERSSWVILLTDLNSRVPVSIAPGNGKSNPKGATIQAIMAGDNSAMPALDSLPQNAALHEGDQVVSSGDGGLLPPGLPIGTVVQGAGGYRVALLADAAASDEVEVLAFRKQPESLPTATMAQLPAVAAGLPPAPPPAPMPATTQSVPATQAKPALPTPTRSAAPVQAQVPNDLQNQAARPPDRPAPGGQ
jgi:rod shape-determining protein MreC